MIFHSKPSLSSEEFETLKSLFEKGQLAVGNEIENFENAVKNYVGMRFSAAVVNGTSALHLALLALGVGEKTEVLLPNSSCAALLNSVKMVGAKPVLVDVNPYDCNFSLVSLEKKITKNTACVIAPHHFGFPCKINEINSLGIPVIEDCAQSVGAKISGKQVGSFTEVSVFSFYATKVLTSIDGGMVVSNNEKIIEEVKDRTYYGGKTDGKLRFNYKLSNVAAAIGNVQMKKLDFFIERRKALHKIYSENIKSEKIIKVQQEQEVEPIFYRFVFRGDFSAKWFCQEMEKHGISCGDAVFYPLNRMIGENDKDFPETLKWFENGVSIPFYPGLTNEEIEKILEATNKTLERI
ncbi:DegT/DnrJ/EryC1/StrS family aminotransferase [bacterium]|nr:DegT/DnrJ/EryC1/StrS family aminotransferase [bacterium]